MDGIALIFIGIICLVAGFAAAWLWKGQAKTKEIRTDTTVLLERIEKVFKVVLAEGHFSEIHDHTDQKELFFGIKAGAKKALIVTRAKVSVGYDFKKVDIQWDASTGTMKIVHIPEPEILSIDSDYKIYDIEQGFFNRFNKDEYTQLLSDAKQVIHNKAVASELPQVAARQVKLLLGQIAETSGWKIDYALPEKITPLALPSNPE